MWGHAAHCLPLLSPGWSPFLLCLRTHPLECSAVGWASEGPGQRQSHLRCTLGPWEGLAVPCLRDCLQRTCSGPVFPSALRNRSPGFGGAGAPSCRLPEGGSGVPGDGPVGVPAREASASLKGSRAAARPWTPRGCVPGAAWSLSTGVMPVLPAALRGGLGTLRASPHAPGQASSPGLLGLRTFSGFCKHHSLTWEGRGVRKPASRAAAGAAGCPARGMNAGSGLAWGWAAPVG